LSKRWPDYADYEIKHSVEDIRRLLEHLAVDQVTLVGHSLGALIALAFIHTYPDKVTSLVLLSPTPGLDRLTRTKITHPLITGLNLILNFLPVLVKTKKRTDYTSFINTPDWSPRRIYTDVSNTGMHAYCYFFGACV